MRDQFVNSFIAKIYNVIPEEYLSVIRNKLFQHVNNYDISPRETSVAKYTGYLPDFYKIYFVSRKIEGLSQGTLDAYNLYLNDFFFTVNKRVEDITPNDIRVYLYTTQQTRNLSNRTLDSRRTAIHAFFEWAANENYIGKNPCRSIKNIKYERIQKKPLTDIELEKIRQACSSLREQAIVEFLFSTGARVSELCNVKKSDVDLENGEATVLGKGNKHRTVYLNAKCKLLLYRYLKSRTDDSEYLFVSIRRPYKQLKKSAVEKIIREIGEHTDINRRLTLHLFRHTLATCLLQRKTPIVEVQRILGHVNIETTMIYSKVSDNDAKTSHMKYAF